MNDPEVVLQSIHENAEMGRETLAHLEKKADASLRELMRRQQADYDSILAQSCEMLAQLGVKPSRPSFGVRLAADMGMDMKTARDKRPAKMAQMLITGAAMGVTDLKEELERHPDMHPKIRALGEELITLEQNQMQQWQHLL